MSLNSSDDTVETGGLSVQDTIDLLAEDAPDEKVDTGEAEESEVEPTGTEEETETEEDSPEKELEEIQQELEELSDDDERLELITPARRAEILKAFPDLFKKFPYLQTAYYRDQQFTQIFPTLSDARDAAEKSSALDNFEQELNNGNIGKVFQAIKEESPNAFNKVVDNLFPALFQADKGAYDHVMSNFAKHTVAIMVRAARQNNNEDLAKAAETLNEFVFGSKQWTPPTNLAKAETKDPAKEEIEKERQSLKQEKFNNAFTDLHGKTWGKIRSVIDTNIDPKNSMSDYVKSKAIQDACENLEGILSNHPQLSRALTRLWQNAEERGYDADSRDKIRRAYLSVANTVLPTVIKTARNAALRGIGKRVRDDAETTTVKTPVARTGASTTSPNRGNNNNSNTRDPKKIPHNVKTIDFLNS